MGTIQFNESLTFRAINLIKEQEDLSDVLNDLNRIEQAKAGIDTYDGVQRARNLDNELRHKYPAIDMMLNAANKLSTMLPSNIRTAPTNEPSELSSLQQDRCGIICDTLLKKGITTSIEEYIDRVD